MSEINELRNKLIELQTESADVRVAIEELQAELDKLEQQPKPWPQVGDEYWCAGQTGHVYKSTLYGDSIDHYRLATGNCHRTEAEAVAYREWQTDPRVVARRFVEMCDGFSVFGNYEIHVRRSDHLLQVSVANDQWSEGSVGFGSESQARAAITKLGEPLIKVALGVITDKEEAERIVRLAMGKVQSVNGQEAIGRG